ncbi:hypothetical protein JXA32_01675 [Candidatus Sumerlaeota bacterium]|nr:hypothetical protein [Candidatus Sumerlaeota bacterium]
MALVHINKLNLFTAVFGFALLVLFSALSLRANINTVEYDTSVAGQLVPVDETEIRVLDEELEIYFEQLNEYWISNDAGVCVLRPLRAHVTAKYRLENPSNQDRAPLIAFPILRNGAESQIEIVRLFWDPEWTRQDRHPESIRRGVRASVIIDDQEIPSKLVAFEDLFEAQRKVWATGVREWLAEWPEVAEMADRSKDLAFDDLSYWERYGFSTRKKEEFPNIDDVIEKLLRIAARQISVHQNVEEWDLDVLSFLNSRLYPDNENIVAVHQERWGAEPFFIDPASERRVPIEPLEWAGVYYYDLARLNQRIDFLQYRPVLPAGKTIELKVEYSHLLDVTDMRGKHNPHYFDYYTNQFQYILRTSPKWKNFGPIKIQLALPANKGCSISLPMEYLGEQAGMDRYRYTLDGATADKNLLIGMEGIWRWGYYWGIGKLPGDDPESYLLDVMQCWRRYQENPTGPFADDLLYRMAWQIMLSENDKGYYGKVSDEKLQQLACELKLDATAKDLWKTASIQLLNAIPSDHFNLHYDGQLMALLCQYKGESIGADNIKAFQQRLIEINDEERDNSRKLLYCLPKGPLKNYLLQHKQESYMYQRKALDDLLCLCDIARAGLESKGYFFKEEPSREAQLKAAMACAKIEYAAQNAPYLELKLLDDLDDNLVLLNRLWSIYQDYKDVPEAADLLRLLKRECSNNYFLVGSELTEEDIAQRKEFARMIEAEAKASRLRLPQDWYNYEHPEWLTGVPKRSSIPDDGKFY